MSLQPVPLKEKLWLYLWWYPRFYWLEKKICVALKLNLDDYLGPYCRCGHRFSKHVIEDCLCTKCKCTEFLTNTA